MSLMEQENEYQIRNKESQKTIYKRTVKSPYISVTILNVNRLNSPIKRQRMAEWILKPHKI